MTAFCGIKTSCDKRINPGRTGNCFSKFTHIIFAFKKHHFVFISLLLKMCLRFFLSVYEPVCGPVCHPGTQKMFFKISSQLKYQTIRVSDASHLQHAYKIKDFESTIPSSNNL